MPAGEANSITYFRSRAPTNFTVPAPFSSAERLVAAGWDIGHWRGETLPLDDSTLRDLLEQEGRLRPLDQPDK